MVIKYRDKMVRGIKPKVGSTYFLMLSLLFTVTGVIFDSITLLVIGILSFFYGVFVVVLSEKRQRPVMPMPHERFRAQTIIIVGIVNLILLALWLIGAI